MGKTLAIAPQGMTVSSGASKTLNVFTPLKEKIFVYCLCLSQTNGFHDAVL